jgi:hypothetical protein
MLNASRFVLKLMRFSGLVDDSSVIKDHNNGKHEILRNESSFTRVLGSLHLYDTFLSVGKVKLC